MSALEQLYQQVILDHARERHGHDPQLDLHGGHVAPERLAPQAGESGVSAASRQRNPLCGDEVLLEVTVAERDRVPYVVDVVWGGDGCSISQAATSVLYDMTVDRPVSEVESLLETYRTMIRSRARSRSTRRSSATLPRSRASADTPTGSSARCSAGPPSRTPSTAPCPCCTRRARPPPPPPDHHPRPGRLTAPATREGAA